MVALLIRQYCYNANVSRLPIEVYYYIPTYKYGLPYNKRLYNSNVTSIRIPTILSAFYALFVLDWTLYDYLERFKTASDFFQLNEGVCL